MLSLDVRMSLEGRQTKDGTSARNHLHRNSMHPRPAMNEFGCIDEWIQQKRTGTPHSHSSRPTSSTSSLFCFFCVAFGVVKISLTMSSTVLGPNDSIDSIERASADGIACVSMSCQCIQQGHARWKINKHRPNISISLMPASLSSTIFFSIWVSISLPWLDGMLERGDAKEDAMSDGGRAELNETSPLAPKKSSPTTLDETEAWRSGARERHCERSCVRLPRG